MSQPRSASDNSNRAPSLRQHLVDEIRARALSLGFEAFGIAAADSRPDLPQKLRAALNDGHHAGMAWMGENTDRRANPKTLWPQARSIIMLGINYGPETDPLEDLKAKTKANISVYARNRDYHEIVKGKLKEIGGLLARRTGGQVKVFVDTAPVMEKPLAEAAGIGWQGKHSALVSKQFGSWLFLGTIYTDVDLPVDQSHAQNCGTCTECLDICPTNAFPAPFKLDASKCLAYYSNEHHGPIPVKFRKPMGNRVFGCDDCLAVCPWNKFASTTREAKLKARDELLQPDLGTLVQLDEQSFRTYFSRSPLKRLGHARFLRNVLIAIGNSGENKLLKHAEARLRDGHSVVRGAAVWAVRQLADDQHQIQLQKRFAANESDKDVLREWAQAI